MVDIHQLVETLRQPGVRMGIGVWLLPDEYLGQETSLAVKLDAHPIDARKEYLKRLPEGARFSGLTRPNGHQKLLDLLRALATTTYSRDSALVYTLDLLLWGLEVDERIRFWQGALDGIPYPKTKLILTIPAAGYTLLPRKIVQRHAMHIAKGNL